MGGADGLVEHEDGTQACWWGAGDPDYRTYHDHEWGRPVADDTHLFEILSLEGFQSGLSWLTILRKRENFRRAFRGFDIETVARFNSRSVERLLRDTGIVRHRGKIEAVINNARRSADLINDHGRLAAYAWRYEPDPATRPDPLDKEALVQLTTSPESVAMGKDLKKRGWAFVGPTTVYSFMQSGGIVNDHLVGCSSRPGAIEARKRFVPPA